jgi:hypothetical protein
MGAFRAVQASAVSKSVLGRIGFRSAAHANVPARQTARASRPQC